MVGHYAVISFLIVHGNLLQNMLQLAAALIRENLKKSAKHTHVVSNFEILVDTKPTA
jgi:hypothetical protein